MSLTTFTESQPSSNNFTQQPVITVLGFRPWALSVRLWAISLKLYFSFLHLANSIINCACCQRHVRKRWILCGC